VNYQQIRASLTGMANQFSANFASLWLVIKEEISTLLRQFTKRDGPAARELSLRPMRTRGRCLLGAS
jgi:hypothetical protein